MSRDIQYTVKGHWPFPLDMLRHDQARAAEPADQAAIDRLSTEHATDRDAFVDVEICLIAPFKPNTARWESFGWTVPSDEDHALMKALTAAAERRREQFEAVLAKLDPADRQVILDRIAGECPL